MRLLSVTFLMGMNLIVTAVLPFSAQTQSAQKPSFEVASIKRSDPGQGGGLIMNQPGGRLVIRGMPFRELLLFAYQLQDFQISGGPGWIGGPGSDFWDIEARAEEGSIPPPTGLPNPNTPNALAMRLQSLLEDRFQLKMHRETKELPIYELSIAKGGSKVKLSDDQTPFQPPERGAPPPPPFQLGGPLPRFSMRVGRGNFEGVSVNIGNIVQTLSSMLGRTVVDQTGLKALYDVKLQWTPDGARRQGGLETPPAGPALTGGPEAPPTIDPNGPSIFTALQEQLGLKLESAKGPVEVLVIDSVQRPSNN